jgi:glutamate racemase
MGPVGIYDSGIGGLSVALAIRHQLPDEELLYVADTAWCPYGDRDEREVRQRALAIGRHIQDAGARLLVVACNTASGAALEHLREALSIPVVGLEPAVKTGVALTRNGRVGVMATSGTLRSERFARLVRTHANGALGVSVIPQPCPGLADLIEQGHLDGPVLESRLAELTRPLREAQADTVVLGCTHYPFVRDAISRALGDAVTLVDSAPAIARRTAALLPEKAVGAGSFRLLTTGEVVKVAPVVQRLWGGPVPVAKVEI